jgi:TonB-dependent SusC/RagA subfamily outer membrane receptor
MKNPVTGLNVLVIVFALLSAGCVSSKSATDEVGGASEAAEEEDDYTARVRSEGLSGAAAQSVGWEDTVDGKEGENQPFSFTEQLLHGQVAGVEVLERPGGGIAVRIRGNNSLLGGSDPLYVVDGMPVLHRSHEGLSWLNTRDIAKIEVIKDIDARALYGSRGANGVVLITTKLGPQKKNDQ